MIFPILALLLLVALGLTVYSLVKQTMPALAVAVLLVILAELMGHYPVGR